VADFSTNPYIGPRPFERRLSDEQRFAGRDREAEEIMAYILGHPVVLVYAQSGAGKTSLFNAQIIPALEQEHRFEVMPIARVQGIIPVGLDPELIGNIFAFNALRSISPNTNPQELVKMTLAEFLKEYPRGYDEEENRPAVRALVIDQFEELFGLVPAQYQEQREGFFQQIAKSVEDDPLLRVVLVIREDFLAQLDPFIRLLPEGLRIRFRLECLKRDQALQAIEKPLAGTGREFNKEAARHLVHELSRIKASGPVHDKWLEGSYVEPVQLQVVCRKLWSNLDVDTKVISWEDIKALDVDRSLSDYYEEIIQGAAGATRIPEFRLRKWFGEMLITPLGTRGTVFKGWETTGGIPNETVEWLARRHLIRAEYRSGASWYELTHDRFIEPILTSNKVWFAGREDIERVLLSLEQKAAEWVRLGRGPGGLLDEIELLDAERWLDKPGLEELASDDLRTYIQVSHQAINKAREEKEVAQQRELEQAQTLANEQRKRAEENASSARLRLKAMGALVVVSIVSLGAATYALVQREDALLQRKDALDQRNIASQRGILAIAVNDLAIDPERSLIVALRVAQEAQNEEIIKEAADVLGRAVQASRVRKRLSISTDQNQARVVYNYNGILLAGITEEHRDRVTLWESQALAFRQLMDTHSPAFRELIGHEKEITDMDFAAQVDRLATGSKDKTARVWNTASGEHQSFEHEAEVFAVALSGDGKLLAAATPGDSGSLRIWDIDANKPHGKLDGKKLPFLTDIRLNRDGKYLATTDSYGTLSVWNVASGIKKAQAYHDDIIESVRFSPDGNSIATGSIDMTARIWDVQTGDELKRLTGHTNSVFDLAFSPDGSRIATASADTTVKVYDRESGRDLFTLRGHTNPIRSVSFSPDGKHVASASWDGTARIWDVSGHTEVIRSRAFSDDGRRCVTADIADQATIWDAESGDAIFNGRVKNITVISLSSRGDRFATGNKDGLVALWDGNTGKRIRDLPYHSSDIRVIRFNKEGTRLVTGDIGGRAILWDTETGKNMLTMIQKYADVTSVAFSADNTMLATSDGGGNVRLWNPPNDQPRELKGHANQVFGMEFSVNGKYLITASQDGSARLWNLKSLDSRLLKHLGMVFDATFSLDGARVATVSADRTAKIWNIDSPDQRPLILEGHSNVVESVVFSPDGQRVATASWDRTARIWDVNTGKELLALTHSHEVNDLRFSADGTRLTTVSADGTVRVQPLNIDELMELARMRITRQMEPSEHTE
jgi:WD40 repeat protein